MFILDGRPLSPDVAFTHDGIQYPANWLRSASPEERAAIGITDAPQEPFYDQRFYWSPELPKDHAQLVGQWIAQTKATAGTLLNATDWMVTRSAEPNGQPVPEHVLAHRVAIRAACNDKEAALLATPDTAALAAYVTSEAYASWPTMETITP